MASVRRIESFLNAEVGKFTSENKDLDTDGRIFTTLDPSSILIAIPITGEIIRNQKGEIDVDVFALSLVASSLVPLLPAGNGRNGPHLAPCALLQCYVITKDYVRQQSEGIRRHDTQ